MTPTLRGWETRSSPALTPATTSCSRVGTTMKTEPRTDWTKLAACVDKPHKWWFPEQGMNPTKAIEVCMDCPVRIDCLTFALRTNQPHGVWGGLTTDERRDPRMVKLGYVTP